MELTVGEPAQPKLQKFDLNFQGGNPEALVAAIEKATGKPLNAIVPNEERNVQIPPMKLTNVTVPDLFEALKMASTKRVYGFNSITESAYGFETKGQGADAVWCFRSYKPREPQPESDVCRFFQLAPYLENFTIEDITTAVQTGWELLGIKPTPRLKFHPETKLLIAVGQPEQIGTIEAVLAQLRNPTQPPFGMPGVLGRPTRALPPQAPKKDGTSKE
jgi:hypothetical protein